jgi:cysteinyl-tRNA synthetase
MADIYLFNSLTRKKEKFEPINPPNVGMYTCGPTVYWSTHVGHMSKYIGDDVLKRVLIFNGFKVKHVMNVTDVGHLTSDADEGEDKMEKGAKREGTTVWDIAKKYEKEFFNTMDALNVIRADVVCRATEHIQEQIDLISRLEKNGLTYQTDSAVYYDVSKFSEYGKLSNQKLSEKIVGAREDVVIDSQKKNPYDFALWFKTVGRFKNHVMHWDSPWGDGFPGWHIECSAMSMKYLGESFDIHTGGIDHLGVHHPAEIAQSEGATGKKFVKYWIHRVFILVDGQKMSKSLGNFYTLEDIKNKNFDSLALRYLILTGHYRQPLNFTWESLQTAQNTLRRLREQVIIFKLETQRTSLSPEKNEKIDRYRNSFIEAINDDLNSPKALTVLWEVVKSNIPASDKYDLIVSFDEVLGLGLAKVEESKIEISDDVKKLLEEREVLRKKGDFVKADMIRKEVEDKGFEIEDMDNESIVKIKGK